CEVARSAPEACWSRSFSPWPFRSRWRWRSWGHWRRCAWRSGSTPRRCSVASPRLRTEARLLRAALGRRGGTVALAVMAVAIGASVASALLHVSGDIGRKVTRELRALGPNLLVVPATVSDDAPGRFLDEATLRERLAAAGVTGVPLLYASA